MNRYEIAIGKQSPKKEPEETPSSDFRKISAMLSSMDLFIPQEVSRATLNNITVERDPEDENRINYDKIKAAYNNF